MSQENRNPAEYTWSYEKAAQFIGVTESTFRSFHAWRFSKVKRSLGSGKSNQKFLHPDDIYKYKLLRDQGQIIPKTKAESAKLAQVS